MMKIKIIVNKIAHKIKYVWRGRYPKWINLYAKTYPIKLENIILLKVKIFAVISINAQIKKIPNSERNRNIFDFGYER